MQHAFATHAHLLQHVRVSFLHVVSVCPGRRSIRFEELFPECVAGRNASTACVNLSELSDHCAIRWPFSQTNSDSPRGLVCCINALFGGSSAALCCFCSALYQDRGALVQLNSLRRVKQLGHTLVTLCRDSEVFGKGVFRDGAGSRHGLCSERITLKLQARRLRSRD